MTEPFARQCWVPAQKVFLLYMMIIVIRQRVPIETQCLFGANYDAASHIADAPLYDVALRSCPSPPTQRWAICSMFPLPFLPLFQTHNELHECRGVCVHV